MRKIFAAAVLAVLSVGAAGPALAQEENAPVLSGLPVRASAAGKALDDLGFVDFELSVAGRKVPLDAVVFVRDNAVERREGPTYVEPPDRRRIDLVFGLTHFSAGLEAALKDFMLNKFRPGDELTVRTPRTTYTLSPYALEAKSREALAQEVAAAVRSDIESVTRLYDDILTNLRQLAVVFGGSRSGAAIMIKLTSGATGPVSEAMDRQIPRYRASFERLIALRHPDNLMKEQTGEDAPGPAWNGPRITLLFFEHAFLPVLPQDIMTTLLQVYQERNPKLLEDIQALDRAFQNAVLPDETRLKRFFGRGGGQLYLFDIPAKVEDAGLGEMKPFAEEFFAVEAGIAVTSGGMAVAPGDPAVDLPKIMDLLGTYYILFYKPRPQAKDEGAGALAISVGLKRRTADLTYPQYAYTTGKG